MIAYVSGEYLPHEDAKISIDDRSIMLGDCVWDTLRTYGGKPFRLEDHLERLRRSLRYIELDADPVVDEVREATIEVIEQNRDEIADAGDVWIDKVVTRGIDADQPQPTIIVKVSKIPFERFGALYGTGINLNVSMLNQHFAGAADPRLKGANRLAATRAELKGLRARKAGGQYWTVVFGPDGSIAETESASLCIVADGRLVRPPRHTVLEGISMRTLCELAEANGIPVEERPIFLYDLVNAEETMLTSTSVGVLAVHSIDGVRLQTGGSVYQKLLKAWIEFVDFDFVQQAADRSRAVVGAA